MFGNYVKIWIRNLKKYKTFSFINICGLAIGLACVILIYLWSRDELSYDRFHKDINKIFRVIRIDSIDPDKFSAYTPPPLAPAIKNEVPEIEAVSRFSFTRRHLVGYKDKSFFEGGFIAADNDFFEIFSFPMIQGSPLTALSDPNSVVITEKIADKYFGKEESLGKILIVGKKSQFKITGVLKNIPLNSHLQFDFIIPFKLFGNLGVDMSDWWDLSYCTYVKLKERSSPESVRLKINECMKKHRPDLSRIGRLQRIDKIHLFGGFISYEYGGHGDIKNIYIFSSMAVIVLIIAAFNFMNLSTARSSLREKEIGMRKVSGAGRAELAQQFFAESVLFVLMAFFTAILIVTFVLPFFNSFSGKQLTLNMISRTDTAVGLFLIFVLTSLLSSVYPVIFLSSFKPVDVLKSSVKYGLRASVFRKIMVVIQFTLSIIMIIGTLVIYKQLIFLKNKDLGYNKKNILCFSLRGNSNNYCENLKNDLLSHSGITSITVSNQSMLYSGSNTQHVGWDGKEQNNKISFTIRSVDFDYLKTFEIEMAQGRFFSPDFPSDKDSYILNEAAIKAMDLKSPLGKRFSTYAGEGEIIGIVKDFHFMSLHNEIEPLFLKIMPERYSRMFVKIAPDNIPETIDFIKGKWNQHVPGYPFEFSFLDKNLERMYWQEKRIKNIIQYFAFLAVFISCLGLLGLASFMIQKRTKEIGIRKVIGAPVYSIIVMLSKQFLIWVILANVIAVPAAWFFAARWLENFKYRTSLNLEIFLITAFISFLLALLTIGFQTFKAARKNPVDTLKYE